MGLTATRRHRRQAAEAIGHGDLRHDIQVQGHDEVAHMLRRD